MRSSRYLLTCIACVMLLGLSIRTAGLWQANKLAVESRMIDSQMQEMRRCIQQVKQSESHLNANTWRQIQAELVQLHPDFSSQYELTWQKFDPAARVRLLPGPDQQPGTIDLDDNANGVIDDAGELGATFSDDQCIVEAAGSQPSSPKPSLVLQRGTYVDRADVNTQQSQHADRILITRGGVTNSWSFVVDW